MGQQIKDSSNNLKNREKGLDLLISSWDNGKFFDDFNKELMEIEKINDRVEREIDAKVNQRIQRYGIDSKRILGRDVQLPPRDLGELKEDFHEAVRNYNTAPTQPIEDINPFDDQKEDPGFFVTSNIPEDDPYQRGKQNSNRFEEEQKNQHYEVKNSDVYMNPEGPPPRQIQE